ncbi:MAG: MTH1187 family thiamine-binding protein [Gammaproteobacteria bacterium]|nr:MAG: MTH1187 family thiamine-binding protein [Gammaproteobacteria bacterium]
MKVIAELSVTPIGVGLSLSKYIVECERILKNKKLTIQLHAEGTNIEGELDEVFEAIKSCIEAVHQLGAPRLMTNIKISSRTDKIEKMADKIQSVEKQL